MDVYAQNGRWLGAGYANGCSKLRVRILSRNPNDTFGEAFYRRRVKYAVDCRRAVMGEAFSACRLVFGEADELFRQMLAEAAKEVNVRLRQLYTGRQGPDHPILWGVPETDYLKFYIFQVVWQAVYIISKIIAYSVFSVYTAVIDPNLLPVRFTKMEDSRRHQLLWRLAYYPVRLFMRLRFRYQPRVQPIEAPALIVSNHVTDLDPLFLGLTIKNFAYFVASEHVFRKNGKLLLWAQGPIARMKGDSGGDTALTAIRRMRKGFSVALFAEGNRTFNGVTVDIVESTAKLARVSGASLVTHRFKGGYLTSPRWAGRSIRRGRFTGEIVRVLSPAELKAMTPAEIADIIRKDIYEDAYETQQTWNIPYKGKNLAEHIERAVCVCPKCETLGSLSSEGNRFSCSACGLTGVYTPEGWLEGEELPFRTVRDWDRWQAAKLQALTDAAGEEAIASDDDIDLCEILDDFQEVPSVHGRLRVFRDRFELSDRRLFFRDISGIAINGPQTVVFTMKGRHFTLKSDRVRNLRKYLTLYRAATAPDKILAI